MPDRLEEYLTFVLIVTRADRCLIVDESLRAIASRKFDVGTLQSAGFTELATQVLTHAVETQEPVITNNVVTDPSDAPTTNTSFSDLRIVVALPIAGFGAIYMDRPVKGGVFSREQLDQLRVFSAAVLASDFPPMTADELTQQFQAS